MKISVHALAIMSSLASVVVGGTLFFRYVEGWSWIDAYFFTIITLSTVGYGNVVPETTLGKLGTTIFIFVGLGVFAFAIQHFANYSVQRREEKMKTKKNGHKSKTHHAHDPDGHPTGGHHSGHHHSGHHHSGHHDAKKKTD